MTSQESKEQLKKLPDKPGVYFFKHDTKILYIGKATSLKDRVRSYFSPDLIHTRGQFLVDMVMLANTIDFTPTDSVLEALLLEANLIRKYLPKYNTKEKDNKSHNYVVFTKGDFPQVFTIRGRTLFTDNDTKKYKYIFGPFPHGGQLREAMKVIRKLFPFRDNKCIPAEDQRAQDKNPRPCFNRHIGLCPGVCTGEITKEEYAERIHELVLFFEAKKKDLIKYLEKTMKTYAKEQKFERADEIKKTLFSLNHIQDIALLKSSVALDESAGGTIEKNNSDMFRIEAYDVAHSSGTSVVGVMVVVSDGEPDKSQYRKFKIKIKPGINDIAALKEILQRRLGHLEWPMPSLIVVDGGKAQLNVAVDVLHSRGLVIPVVGVVKDERHKPKGVTGNKNLVLAHTNAILLANSEAHRFAITYHRKKRDKIV